MTRANVSYTDFSSGEISPKVYGRFDLAAFYSGHKRIENFDIESVGQASFRNGFNYAATTSGNNPAFLYTWTFSDSVSYVLEFTNTKLRFYSNNGIVESGGMPYEITTPFLTADLFQLKFAQNGVDLYITHPSHNPQRLRYTSATSWAISDHSPIRETFAASQRITGITVANPPVVTYAGGDNFTNGTKIKITGVSGMTEVNDEFFLIANVNTGANTFQLQDLEGVNIDGSGYNTYSSGGIIQRIVETPAPFLSANEYPSCVAFYEDRIVYGGSNNKPQTLWFSRSAEDDDFSLGDEADDGIEYVVSGDGNTVQWLKGNSRFLAVGTFGDVLQATGGSDGVITPTSISIRPSNSYGVANINPLAKNTQIFYMQGDGLILRSFEFQFEVDAYIPVDRTVIADHITRSGVSQIAFQESRPNVVWAVRNDGILAGMTIEESEGVSGWRRHTTNGLFTSVTTLPRPNAGHQLWACVKRTINGSDYYYVEYMNDSVVFPERSSFFMGDLEQDESMYRNEIFEAQKGYIHVDSCLSYYGDSVGLTAGAGVTPAAPTGSSVVFTSSAAVFSSAMVGRQIWKKSVTGEETGRAEIKTYTSTTQVTCEILEDFDSAAQMAAGDWYLTTDEVTGLNHLEGEVVTIVADGGQHAQRTIASGGISLDRQSSVVHVGLGYTGYLETNSLEGGGTTGTSQTKKKNVSAVGIRFLSSLFAKVGTGYYNLEQIYERTASMNMDRPPLPYTGDKKITLANRSLDSYDGGWEINKRVIIVQENPFPCNIQLIVPYMDVSN